MHPKKNVYLGQMSLELAGANYYYFPYSVGVIWSYANCDPLIAENYQLKEFLYRKEPIQDIVNRLDNPSVFGLSSYIWNTNYNQELAIAVKSKWPQCKIIMGGANVPDHDYSYFESRPYVDFIVHQEGEISFLAILKNLLNKLDINSVPGISYNDNGKRIHTGPGHRINDLSQIPSPYTSGMFDNILKDAQENGRIMQGILETNRGCPFKCTFCDWGGTTFSKIKMFDISRVQEEIDWFAQNKIEYINGTDANFGIFKDRDMAIIDYLIQSKKTHDYPKIFDTSWNKNNNEVTVDMARKLMDAGMLRRFTASLQSMSQKVLSAIKRTNLDGEQLDNIAITSKQKGLHITTELIVGLPNETYDSWKQGITWLLEHEYIIEAFPLTILSNSEMNKPEYKKEYGITSEQTTTYFSKYVDEHQEMVVGTKSMPPEMLKRVWLWSWFTIMLHGTGFTNMISKYMHKRHDIEFETFYEHFLQYAINNKNFIMNPYIQEWQGYADRKEFQYFNAGFPYKKVLESIGFHNRAEFFKGLREACCSLVQDNLIDDLIALQEIQQSTFEHKFDDNIKVHANLYDYIEKDHELIIKDTEYNVKQSRINHPTWFEFMNFARKNGSWRAMVTQVPN